MKKAKKIKDYEGFEKSLYQGCYVDLCDLFDNDKATYDKYIEKFRQKQNPSYDFEQILKKIETQRS